MRQLVSYEGVPERQLVDIALARDYSSENLPDALRLYLADGAARLVQVRVPIYLLLTAIQDYNRDFGTDYQMEDDDA